MIVLAAVLCVSIFAACNPPGPVEPREDPYADQSEGFDIVHTVTFDLNGGTGNLKTRKIGDGQGIGQFDVPTKDGKLFLGWTTEKDNEDTLIAINYAITEDVTLYAFWADASDYNTVKAAILATAATYTAFKTTFDNSYPDDRDLIGFGNSVVNLKNSHVESGYMTDTANIASTWLVDGIYYVFDTNAENPENYKFTSPKDRSGNLVGPFAEMVGFLDDKLVMIGPTHFNNDGNGKYSYVGGSPYAHEFYVSEGKLTKLALGAVTLEFKFDGGYDFPAVASLTGEQRYAVTIIEPDGDRAFIGGVLKVTGDSLTEEIDAGYGYQLEGLYKDAAFTADQKVTLGAKEELALTADLTLYAKYVEIEGATGLVLRAYGASLKKTDYVIKYTEPSNSSNMMSITVRKKSIIATAFYEKDDTIERWSDGKKIWEKTAEENTVKNIMTSGYTISGYMYSLQYATEFTLKDGSSNVYAGNYGGYTTFEVTVDNGLVTSLKYGSGSYMYEYTVKYDNLTVTGIPERPQLDWIAYHQLTIHIVIDGSYLDAGAPQYLKTITEDDVKQIAERRNYEGWALSYYTNPTCTVAAVFPINADADIYVKPAAQTYSFVTNGGSAVANVIAVSLATSPVTTKEGKFFAGWYDNAALTGDAVSFPYINKDKTTLYAAWSDSRNGSTFGSAYIAAPGQYTTNGNKDTYFVLTPTATGTYTFYSENGSAYHDTYGYLYDSELKQIANDDDGNRNAQFRLSYKLEAGKTYYLKASYHSSVTVFEAYTVFITAE
jgi:uncharacterized repeat protein (TIGR02543 family)